MWSLRVLVVLVGILVVSIPVAIAARTVIRLTRVLGGVDGEVLGSLVASEPTVSLPRLGAFLDQSAPGSLPARLVDAVLSGATPSEQEVALAESVSDIERSIADDVRVPRTAASLASSGGLLAAAVVMRDGLARNIPAVDASGAPVDPVVAFQSVIERGLTVAAIAVLGSVVCASLHRSAQRQRRTRLDELDALASPLAAWTRTGGGASTTPEVSPDPEVGASRSASPVAHSLVR